MAGSTLGQQFRITTWGESHGPALGVVIDGCPAGIPLTEADIQVELDRRKPGQTAITTPRKEADAVEILSGVFTGEDGIQKTTGTPISLMIRNTDQRSGDYEKMKQEVPSGYRKGHADEVYDMKYGFRDHRGGGRASARETAARVAAGAIAKKVLPKELHVFGYSQQIGEVVGNTVDQSIIEDNDVRAADAEAAPKMVEAIKAAMRDRDSLGGVVELQIINCPVGLGEPVFDKLKADLAKAMLSIPAVVGFEYGAGFAAASMRGSEHNELEVGMYGGISNGQPMTLRVVLKPTSSIKVTGRHDPCVVPRAVPIVEAMAYLVLADLYLRNSTSKHIV